MKKYLAVIFIGVLLFTGCGKIRHSRSHYVRPSHPQIRHGRYVRPSHRSTYRSTYRSPVRHGSSRSNHIRR